MRTPKTFAKPSVGQSKDEIVLLFLLTTIGLMMLLKLHWLMAMLLAPVAILGLLVIVTLFVEATWLMAVGLERCASAIGLRKSPLS